MASRRYLFCQWLAKLQGVQPGARLPVWILIIYHFLFPRQFWTYLASGFYDPLTDTFTIEGLKIKRSIFAMWGRGPLPSPWFRVVMCEKGIGTIEEAGIDDQR